jgi:hypothetical protein
MTYTLGQREKFVKGKAAKVQKRGTELQKRAYAGGLLEKSPVFQFHGSSRAR